MLKYLENLRKLPEPARKKAVLRLSLLITSVVVVIWIFTLWVRIARTDFSFDANGVKREVPSLGETFSNFFDQVGNILDQGTTTTESQ